MPSKNSGAGGNFPSTNWAAIESLPRTTDVEKRSTLGMIMGGYWKPLYHYLLRRGWEPECARDAVQSFFVHALQKKLLERGNRERGRFRSFLLASFENFITSVHRAEHAGKRHPEGGFVALDCCDSLLRNPVSRRTDSPEAAYHRAWVANLTIRVLHRLQEEFLNTGKEVHLKIFTDRVVEPALSGIAAPPLSDLAASAGITPKEAANRLLTARRAFQRLLREEIAVFATSSAEVGQEAKEIFTFLAS